MIQPAGQGFPPVPAALRARRVPAWFGGAKLGIFIHWGLYSVPGWAPLPDARVLKASIGGSNAHLNAADQRYCFAHNPYAEWYLNTLKFEDGPTRGYHERTYGPDFPYESLVPLFNAASRAWDPGSWADLFLAAGARYVILTAKHHDGFLLWPSRTPCPRRKGYTAERDAVGELTAAIRGRGLKMGLYYSGGLDWAFNPTRIESFPMIFGTVIQEPEFAAYADSHWRELIDRYAPSVLWNDIGYPRAADLFGLLEHYYERVPDGAVNDRFRTAIVEGRSRAPYFDYLTPEYATFPDITPTKWEACRGIGYSFGYNRNDDDGSYLSSTGLIRLLIDIVSKNGNLFLDVGPQADGTIPEAQRERLLAMGRWLARNGESVYDTTPWTRAEGLTADGLAVRFTRKDAAVYAILMGDPRGGRLTIRDFAPPEPFRRVSLLGRSGALLWHVDAGGLTVEWPEGVPPSAAHVLEFASAKRGAGKDQP
jgi:alpha-L-fucosidase